MDVKVAVISTDVLDQHIHWKAALEAISYKDRAPVKIDFPIIEDANMKISKEYGMIHDVTSLAMNIRGVYIISPENIVSSIYFYPNEIGRSMDELKRTLTALQTTYNSNNMVNTPANWQNGDDVIVPVLTQTEKDNLGKPGSKHYEVAWFMMFKHLN
jgi:peroxiredoxin (alkyl hydroperoxide reductase subunit C)